jgi:hypothetical protein
MNNRSTTVVADYASVIVTADHEGFEIHVLTADSANRRIGLRYAVAEETYRSAFCGTA